jgi:hypothetical protein
MKGTNMKNLKNIYVVSWADLDANANVMTSGTCTDIFSSYEKARAMVESMIDQVVNDDMYAFDENDYEDVYGTKDKAAIKRKFICRDTHDFIIVQNPNTGYENQYTITKYSLEYVK